MSKFVPVSDYDAAHLRWLQYFPYRDRDFATFIGEPTLPPFTMDKHMVLSWEMNDEAHKIIRIICDSPHWRTIIKPWAIQYKEKLDAVQSGV